MGYPKVNVKISSTSNILRTYSFHLGLNKLQVVFNIF